MLREVGGAYHPKHLPLEPFRKIFKDIDPKKYVSEAALKDFVYWLERTAYSRAEIVIQHTINSGSKTVEWMDIDWAMSLVHALKSGDIV